MKLQLDIGHRLAPPRFIAFALTLVIVAPIAMGQFGLRQGLMTAFDLAALFFLASCYPLLRQSKAEDIREAARRNDANRAVLLAITAVVMCVILVVVASELAQKKAPNDLAIALILFTLLVAWLFSNLVFALHYAHLYYSPDERGHDDGGLDFPETKEPAYWDFIYFAYTLGMTFQTSDTGITDTRLRKIVTFHCLAAFIFNIGVFAFTINVIGGG